MCTHAEHSDQIESLFSPKGPWGETVVISPLLSKCHNMGEAQGTWAWRFRASKGHSLKGCHKPLCLLLKRLIPSNLCHGPWPHLTSLCFLLTQVTTGGRASYYVSYRREAFAQIKLPKYSLPKVCAPCCPGPCQMKPQGEAALVGLVGGLIPAWETAGIQPDLPVQSLASADVAEPGFCVLLSAGYTGRSFNLL